MRTLTFEIAIKVSIPTQFCSRNLVLTCKCVSSYTSAAYSSLITFQARIELSRGESSLSNFQQMELSGESKDE